MIDKDTARAIAQAKIDKMSLLDSSHMVRPSGLFATVQNIWFILFHPFYHLRIFIEKRRYPDRGLMIVDKYTREEDFGWIFFYESKRFLLTANDAWRLIGKRLLSLTVVMAVFIGQARIGLLNSLLKNTKRNYHL